MPPTAAPTAEAAAKHPQLVAVCQNEPHNLQAGAPADRALCWLQPIHLAAAMGRDRCLRCLLDMGVDPSPWTVPPPAPTSAGGGDADEDPAVAGAEAFASYESVCSSPVYRELKELLPPSSEFAHTFALAQLLLRAPCTPLLLAVRFGQQAAARALLAAMLARDRAQQRELLRHRQECLRKWRALRSSEGSEGGGGSPPASPSSSASDSTSGAASAAGAEPAAGPAAAPSEPGRPSHRLQWELDSALGVWSSSPEPQVSLLRRLLDAGADPLPSALRAILTRYSGCSPTSGLAEKMRAGLEAVLQHLLPLGEEEGGAEMDQGGPGSPGGSSSSSGDGGSQPSSPSSSSSGGGGGGDAGSSSDDDSYFSLPASPASSRSNWQPAGGPGTAAAAAAATEAACARRQRVLGSAEHLRALLGAAIATRDAARCDSLLAALGSPSVDAPPWLNSTANAALLVSAAAHDMPGVVSHLLALPPPLGLATPPFQPNMWGEDGMSALMAAAHRGALGSLGALLAAGATINLADELGATALHWAVVGGREAAVLMLAQHGAAVDQLATVHEEEEHLERPLLTAAHTGNLSMIRLLHQLGASLDAPSPCGYTPLSVAICWEQQEATRLLLSLGADPNQVLPAHVNGGCYQMWSENYSTEEARTLLGIAASRLDWREFVELLLQSGADPTLRHPATDQTPAAEVAGFGAIEEAALILELSAAPDGPWSLQQLDWAGTVAEAARSFYFYACASPTDDASLEPLLDLWRARQPQCGPPPAAACRAIVAGLLRHPALTLREGTPQLAAGAELAGVMQAERLASVGVSADLLDESLQDSPCKVVVLAAAPPSARWSPSRHRFFPPAFKQAARQLLLVNSRLLGAAPATKPPGGEAKSAGMAEGCATGGRPASGDQCEQGSIAAGTAAPRLHEGSCNSASNAESSASGGAPASGSGGGGSAAAATAAAGPPCGLPRDAVHEVLRQLASCPLSYWMKQTTAAVFPPAAPSRVPSAPAAAPPADAPQAAADAMLPLPFLHPINAPPPEHVPVAS
ncbi:hypothetical protein ABPG75_004932 [Micractinium tetrahymenae]